MPKASPADQLQLLKIQELDTKITQLVHQRKTLPVLEKLNDLQGRKTDVDAALVNSRTAKEDLRRELTKAEADVEQVANRIKRNESRLTAGEGSAKDFAALQSELGSLQARLEELEDIQIGVMERLDEHQSTLAELETAADALQVDIDAAEAERDQQDLEIVTAGREATTQRRVLAQAIDQELLNQYERIRKRVGQGAAALRYRRCQGCQLELNTHDIDRLRNAEEDDVLRCEECGRILVRTEESGL